jgi:hypothetical protein
MTAQSPLPGESREGRGSLILPFLLPSSHVAQRGEVHIDDPAGLFVNGPDRIREVGFRRVRLGEEAGVHSK